MLADTLLRWLQSSDSLDVGSAALLFCIFLGAAFLPIPRTLLLIGAGAAVGIKSLLFIIPATTIGCILAFIAARYFLRDWSQRKIDNFPTASLVARSVDAEGWRIVALMRIWGPMPNSVQNFLFGLTNIELLPYALITLICSIPQLATYVYLGATGRSILLEDKSSTFSTAILVVVFLIVIAIIALVARRFRILLRNEILDSSSRLRIGERSAVSSRE
jgi:uncharacterized membrane protein YdjX (TVP38/TMEM64 family)